MPVLPQIVWFRFPIRLRVAAFVVVLVAIGLCIWQIGRNEERNVGRGEALAAQPKGPIPGGTAPSVDDIWREGSWTGIWDSPPLLVGGRLIHDARGYGIVGVLNLPSGERLIVDRGSLPQPEVAAFLAGSSPDAATVRGQLRPTRGDSGMIPVDGYGTQVWPGPAWGTIAREMAANPDVYVVSGEPGGARGASTLADGFVPVPPVDGTSLHYAAQWAALAALAALVALPFPRRLSR